MPYISTKTYPDLAPVAYRQWRADSHCRLLHGYSLSFKFVFMAVDLDARNWVMDFGGLRDLKAQLESQFDHCLLVAEDDPNLIDFQRLDELGLARVRVLPALGCEALSKLVFDYTAMWLDTAGQAPRVKVMSVEVMEHARNSAVYVEDIHDADT